jgi:hypothetical protein
MIGARLKAEAGAPFEHDGGQGTGLPALFVLDDSTAEFSLRFAIA